MQHGGFITIGGYHASIYVQQTQGGGWIAWVAFERKKDFDEGKALIDGIRHRVPDGFADKDSAIQGAIQYAQQAVANGTVGI